MKKEYLGILYCLIVLFTLKAWASGFRTDQMKVASTAYSRPFQQQTVPVIQTQQNPTSGTWIVVPEGQLIPFAISKDVSSENTRPGKQIDIHITNDVYENGFLTFKKGAKGYLIIKSVKPARNLGKGGYIIFRNG